MSRKYNTRSSSKRKRTNPLLQDLPDDITQDLHFAYGGKYVRLDENLIQTLKRVKHGSEQEPILPSVNPYEDSPGMMGLLKCNRPLTEDHISVFSDNYHQDLVGRKVGEMLGNIPLDYLALKRSTMQQDDWNYKYTLPVEPKITDQFHTGTCWLAAALNCLRYPLIESLKLDPCFEFSRGYLFFWNKIEMCNTILESLWALRDQGLDNPYVFQHINPSTSFLSDGGYWQWFVNLVQKYGIVPKNMYNDGMTAIYSEDMNTVLKKMINYTAQDIIGNSEWTDEEFDEYKEEKMNEIYGIVVRFMGEPISKDKAFVWKFKNQEGLYQELKDMTAMKLFRLSAPNQLETKFVFINDDRYPERYWKHYFVEHSMNVVSGKPCHFINVPKDVMKRAMMKSIQLGKPVWIGADVSNDFDPEFKTWDSSRFDINGVVGCDVQRTTQEEQLAHNTVPCHAMTLAGVDCDDNDSDNINYYKWRILNSWGFGDTDHEFDKGYYRMTDSFVDKYLQMAVLDIECFEEEDFEKIIQYKYEPITIKPWDIFGTLALNVGCKGCKH